MEQQRNQLNDQQRSIRQALGQKQGHRFEFQYNDPERNFDRSRVKGMVCTLFDVRDNTYSLALSMCAGGSVSTIHFVYIYNLLKKNRCSCIVLQPIPMLHPN